MQFSLGVIGGYVVLFYLIGGRVKMKTSIYSDVSSTKTKVLKATVRFR